MTGAVLNVVNPIEISKAQDPCNKNSGGDFKSLLQTKQREQRKEIPTNTADKQPQQSKQSVSYNHLDKGPESDSNQKTNVANTRRDTQEIQDTKDTEWDLQPDKKNQNDQQGDNPNDGDLSNKVSIGIAPTQISENGANNQTNDQEQWHDIATTRVNNSNNNDDAQLVQTKIADNSTNENNNGDKKEEGSINLAQNLPQNQNLPQTNANQQSDINVINGSDQNNDDQMLKNSQQSSINSQGQAQKQDSESQDNFQTDKLPVGKYSTSNSDAQQNTTQNTTQQVSTQPPSLQQQTVGQELETQQQVQQQTQKQESNIQQEGGGLLYAANNHGNNQVNNFNEIELAQHPVVNTAANKDKNEQLVQNNGAQQFVDEKQVAGQQILSITNTNNANLNSLELHTAENISQQNDSQGELQKQEQQTQSAIANNNFNSLQTGVIPQNQEFQGQNNNIQSSAQQIVESVQSIKQSQHEQRVTISLDELLMTNGQDVEAKMRGSRLTISFDSNNNVVSISYVGSRKALNLLKNCEDSIIKGLESGKLGDGSKSITFIYQEKEQGQKGSADYHDQQQSQPELDQNYSQNSGGFTPHHSESHQRGGSGIISTNNNNHFVETNTLQNNLGNNALLTSPQGEQSLILYHGYGRNGWQILPQGSDTQILSVKA